MHFFPKLLIIAYNNGIALAFVSHLNIPNLAQESRNNMPPPIDRTRYPLNSPQARMLLDKLADRRQSIKAFRTRANQERTHTLRAADWLIRNVGSVPFLLFHVVLFTIWLLINFHIFPFVEPWDPFPFGLLTMIMTLEQSLLTIFIIISQNRASEIADLRNEIDLQVNVLAEEEISKALTLLRLIGGKLNIDEITNDQELRAMEGRIDLAAIERQTEQELVGKVSRVITASRWTAE